MTTIIESRPPRSVTAVAGAATAAAKTRRAEFVLTLSCPEQPGIVRAVTAFLADRGFDIVEHQQFDDHVSGNLYLRTAFTGGSGAGDRARPDPCLGGLDQRNPSTAESLTAEFAPTAHEFGMDFSIHDGRPQRLLVMVSKFGHCLNDLIFRWQAGSLGAEIAVVVSNHEDLRAMAESAGLTFIHVPVTAGTKPEAEARLLELVAEYNADLVVLARYMQVLSNDLCTSLRGRAINIHHSFLPGFKGAKPYHQAYDRGVKLVGATAHYVTPDLDEGPIIEQEVFRVDHSLDAEALVTVGRDAETQALSRAVKWHCQHRVLLNNTRTVVFR
ncbi:formyltetrahydrofolate deformylase [Pseudarthrobacter raffinosi]|uniref:formyltetrahydrofolate deformylase n=1 Tax=Pseudarthrobacter raffinosi TaxID=2953651 RepID=UPI00208FE221|nr:MULTISPECIES: formyltetrahydrofolate deformylase [unclassified Pseudarthrobacter]MCO4251327.1 formyltetrahydrofolate deformylase [Pseudarthrobacter sp. MDT3-9]MCO4264811.1 formyltetrahydrofolate deformylase [Pseudarthrobacter sp. MDT3-26]